jgi:hypothetical protein
MLACAVATPVPKSLVSEGGEKWIKSELFASKNVVSVPLMVNENNFPPQKSELYFFWP